MYRLLVWLAFPRRFRYRFADDMAAMFERQRAEARRRGDLPRFWISVLADTVQHGGAEYTDSAIALGKRSLTELRRWRWWVSAFLQDLRYSLRMMARYPGSTVIAALTLALGIGANTAIFSAVDAVLLQPLPYPDADRLVMVWEKREREGVLDNVVSPADFLDWARMNHAFEAMAALQLASVDITGAGEPIRVEAAGVSPAFFNILGTPPALGRDFRKEEATVGQHRVAILSHGLWERVFASNPSVLGQKVALNGNPFEVIGVLPPTFEYKDPTIEVWVPLALTGTPEPPTRVSHSLEVYARLKPGVTLERARDDMSRVGAELQRQYPSENRNHSAHVSPLEEELRSPVRAGLLLLFAAVAFVLLIACVNVANLLLARAAARKREMAVRAALGAGPSRLAGQALTESIVLGILGGTAGLLVAYWGIEVMKALAPPNLPVLGAERIRIDGRVLAFTAALSCLTGAVFGLLPAWHLASGDVSTSLKDGGRTGGVVRRRVRVALVVTEIALAALLLVGAGLALRSFQALLMVDPGFRTDGTLTAFVVLPPARYRGEGKVAATFEEIERRLASIPGVTTVGATSQLPLAAQDSRTGVIIEGRTPTPDTPTRAHVRAITPSYFAAMGITLVRGRPFSIDDRDNAPRVAIINEAMAQRYWPSDSAIGKRFAMGATPDEWREVVGVIRNVRHWGFDVPPNPEYYLPERQYPWQSLNFILATDRDPATLAGAVREQLRAVDPELPLSELRTMEQIAAASMGPRRASMLLLAIFGALALVLASAGIYGVTAHLVALRSAEIGIRMSLGATPRHVLRMVLGEGLLQAIAGLAIGVSAGVLAMRTFESMLFGVRAADPVTVAAVVVVLAASALAACLVPARRAMRVDPVEALRI